MQNESQEQLAVFDSLLSGLAESANDHSADSTDFFEKTVQVIETILSPHWVAILASAPDAAVMFLHGSLDAKNELTQVRQNSADRNGRDWIIAPTDRNLIVSEVKTSSSVWGWLAVGTGEEQDDTNSVQREIVRGVSEIVGEFVQSRARRSEAELQAESDHQYRFSLNAHSSLDSVEVAHNLVNDARVLLGCERVTLFSVNRNRPKVLATSSVATIERRSELMRNMKAMVSLALRNRAPIFSDQPADNPCQFEMLEAHRQNTGLPFVFGIPIRRHSKGSNSTTAIPVGFLVAESTHEIDRYRFAHAISFVAPHAEVALTNVASYNAIPFRRTLSAIGGLLNFASVSRLMFVGGLIALAIAAAMTLQTDFKVRIRGELRPVVERNVFSPRDGIVESVFVNHGDDVVENQPLIRIRSPDLDLEIEKSESDVVKLEQLKDSRQIALNQISNANPDPNLAAQLATEISDIDFQIASLVEKAKFLRGQRMELQIDCPIAGQITTWQVKQRIMNKPVRWGDPLINVAHLDGEWEIVFRVPERRIGYILDHQNRLDQDEQVELMFFLESNPDRSFQVQVDEIGESAGQDPKLGTVTLLRCHAPAELSSRRLGASVAADVYCGKKSYWFVWTREVRDALRRRFVW